MPPASLQTVEEFLDVIRKSGVMDESRLQGYLQTLVGPENAPSDANDLAERMVTAGMLTPFQKQQLLRGRWKGFLICGKKYRLLDLLGVGGMGRVFLCEHTRMRRLVALKMLPEQQAANPGAVERFDREARAVAALNHPNIVQAYDVDQDGKMHFLVMEHVEGSSLQDIVSKFGPMNPIRAAHYISQAADGLQHASETAGLIHRDIKPGNLLLDRSGLIKVLDMGLARFFHDTEDKLTQRFDDNSILGTADYISPEQAIDSHHVDIRTDIYSLGATFYFLLTGKPPFPEGTIAQKLLWHQIKEPVPVESYRQDVPPELLAVLRKMMCKNIAERFQSPAEVVVALEPWTQQPIDPPRDEEMPKRTYSLPGLLGGKDPSKSQTRYGRPSPRSSSVISTPSGAIAPSGAFSPGPSSAARAVPVSSAGMSPTISASSTTPRPSSAVYPIMPVPTTTSNPTAAPASPKKKGPPQWVWIAVAVSVAGLITVGAILLSGSKDKGTAAEKTVVIVSRSGDPEHEQTVAGAIQRLGEKGGRIEIDESDWNENLKVEAINMRGRKIVIGNKEKRVRWRPVKETRSFQSLIYLSEATDLTFENIDFDLDQRGRTESKIPAVIIFTGNCAGSKISKCTFQGFENSAVKFLNAVGEPLREISFDEVSIFGPSELHGDTHFFNFESEAKRKNSHIKIENCRLMGPTNSVLNFSDQNENIIFQLNRVSNAQYFLRTSPNQTKQPILHFKVKSNTFHQIYNDFMLFNQIPVRPTESWEFQQNLIVDLRGKLVKLPVNSSVADLSSYLSPDRWNLIDSDREGSKEFGCEVLTRGELDSLERSDPTNNSFLTYAPTSKLDQRTTPKGGLKYGYPYFHK